MNEPHNYQPVVATASTRRRRIISPVWSVPFIAAIIAIYLAWHTFAEEGKEITISFNTADGIIAGQTQIKYKALPLGTVTAVALDKDHKHVIVKAKMLKMAKDLLNKDTRFWVVRPRLSYGNLSGFETLVSGAYIQCDPGEKSDDVETKFTGLEEPPGVRSDEAGTIYTLHAWKMGSITDGSPVYFRDINVGDVTHYEIGDGGYGPINISIFVRAPYDKLVREGTHFWSASGINVNFGASGLEVKMQSIQALLVGGISFYTKKDDLDTPVATKDTNFKLYDSREDADVGNLKKRIAYVTYFQSPVTNLRSGSPVSIYGIRIGEVTEVRLLFDSRIPDAKVRIKFDVEPERAFQLSDDKDTNPQDITQRMVDQGFRIALDGGLLPGKGLMFERVGHAQKETVAMEGEMIVMPSVPSNGVNDVMISLAQVMDKINQIPFAEIGNNLNGILQGLNGGGNASSDFQRDAQRTMDQVNDAARSVRLLADFLNQHPEALIRGRSAKEKAQ